MEKSEWAFWSTQYLKGDPQETLVVESDQGTRKEKQPAKGMLSSKFIVGHQWSLIPLKNSVNQYRMLASKLSLQQEKKLESI